MSAPRVLFVCSELRTGGAERQWRILIPALAERGFEVRLLTLMGRGRFFDEIEGAGVPSRCAGLRNRWDVSGMRRALDLSLPAPDVVVSHETNAQVLGHVIARRSRSRHVTVDHMAPGLPRALHRRLLARFVAGRVDCAVAVSRSQLEELAALGFDPRDVTVIHNGVPALTPARSREEARASLGVESGDFVALMVAAARPEKRIEIFVEACKLAHGMNRQIRGFVAGGGPRLDALRTFASEVGSSVELLGERTDVADVITASDVVCLTSRSEATPIALIEAMALERPVVAPAVGGVDEVVVDGETGLLVREPDPREFAASLDELARNRSHARALGKAGRTRYESLFTVERMVDEYAAVLHDVAIGRPGLEPNERRTRAPRQSG
jgi:glycosyltransferase involved in cell wall biosynthesis